VSQQSFTTQATRYGRLNEQPALTAYIKTTGNNLRSSGLVISVCQPFIASSQDGIVRDSVVVEVKCPDISHMKPVTPFLCERDGKLILKSNHDYYYQIQGQLYTTNQQLCELVIYTLVDLKVLVVVHDDSFINAMVVNLVTFLLNISNLL